MSHSYSYGWILMHFNLVHAIFTFWGPMRSRLNLAVNISKSLTRKNYFGVYIKRVDICGPKSAFGAFNFMSILKCDAFVRPLAYALMLLLQCYINFIDSVVSKYASLLNMKLRQ